MEYRGTPRIAATEGRLDGVIDEADSRPRFRGFEFVRSQRQLDITRVLLTGLLVLAAVASIGYLGAQALRSAIRWLYHQPQYQLRFLDIQLHDEPPAWFRGGTEAFLRQVRDHAREAEVLPVLELEKGRIERDFKLFPWVDDVARVEYPPLGITVHLIYKKPVAMIPFPAGEQVILDRNGHVLPPDDIDTEKLGPLIKITGRGLVPSAENRAGRVWRLTAAGSEATRLDRCVRGAAKLAGFLQEPERAREALPNPALHILAIVATDHRGFFLQNAQDSMIHWGEAPGEELNGGLEAKEKWEILRKWVKSSSRRVLPPGDFWAFSHSELKPVETGRGR
jgi:hypothetical protein